MGASRQRTGYIGTEHMLLGLIKEGSGVGAAALKSLKCNLKKLRDETTKLIAAGSETVRMSMGRMPQTPLAKQAIGHAIEEARNLNHNYVGTEHLLLGLLSAPENVAQQVLRNVGVSLEDVRKTVMDLLGCGEEPPTLEVTEDIRAILEQIRRFVDTYPDKAILVGFDDPKGLSDSIGQILEE